MPGYRIGVWNTTEIIQMMSHYLQSENHRLQDAHAYVGLDSHAEIELHPLLAQAFAPSSFGIHREVGYPSSPMSRPNDAQRQRCDLVLTPIEGQALFDPIHEQRVQDKAVGTLFESFVADHLPDEGDALPEDAYWIEVKSVGQFSYVDGVPGANPKYTADLLGGPRSDVIKLASEPLIRFGGSLVVLFSEDQETGPHDIAASAQAMIEHDLPIAVPVFESFPITNHAGNEWCTLGLIPIRM